MSLIKEKAALAAKIAKLINSADSREIANRNILDFLKNDTLSATTEQQISDTLTQSMRLLPEQAVSNVVEVAAQVMEESGYSYLGSITQSCDIM